MKEVIVTTSWDDGDPLDLRIAELLRQRGLSGTFYIPILGYQGRATLTKAQTRQLADSGFEIGGHTYSHRSLTDVPSNEFERELVDSRKLLQDRTEQSIDMFSYPNGRYDQRTIEAVKAAGYRGARTTRMLRTRLECDLFQIPTTVQAFPHPPMTYLKNTLKARHLGSLLQYSLHIAYSMDWVQFSKATFDHVQREGGVWHLYGHSWEIERFQLWDNLREVLTYVGGRTGALYVTNGELASGDFSQTNSRVARSA